VRISRDRITCPIAFISNDDDDDDGDDEMIMVNPCSRVLEELHRQSRNSPRL
jgi:hypothetical protein